MYFSSHVKKRVIFPLVAIVVLAGLVTAAALRIPATHAASLSSDDGFYQQTNLVSDIPGVAPVTDANLHNPWGLSDSPTSPWWVSDNNAGVSTLYNGDGAIIPLVVTIPLPGGAPGGTPTGTVFNPVNSTAPTDFVVSENGKSGPSLFLFSTEDGTISGWNPNVDGTHAIIAVDRSTVGQGAVYKGLAIGSRHQQEFIYATNFRSGTVEMFDGQFKLVRSFTDKKLASDCPFPGQCFSPFGIQAIGSKLYVTYALQRPGKHDNVAAAGLGFVDVFDTEGHLLRRLAAGGDLNAPWGLAIAPNDFGRFSHDLLVGNFGDGLINVFDVDSGAFRGQLRDEHGQRISINGLWALAFGNDHLAGKHNELFFSAGLNAEANGLFGKIQFVNDDTKQSK
jgi:uncharacterized protein (TIGR03118 family)